MQNKRIFRAFFSYANEDAKADVGLIEALTTELVNRVNVRLVSDRFEIWRDKDDLRLGDLWSPKIESVLRSSDILIVMLTPRWLGSEICSAEYRIFEEVESTLTIRNYTAGYVAPILVRGVEKQKPNLSAQQRRTYESIMARQYRTVLEAQFLELTHAERVLVIDKIADDIESMIERRRLAVPGSGPSGVVIRRSVKVTEIDPTAHDYEMVDFLTGIEVVLGRPGSSAYRDVLAYAGFVERLYVQSRLGRIEFGVQRAFLSISNNGPGQLLKIDELISRKGQTTYYRTRHDAPGALTICIDPAPGMATLGELPLPAAKDENYLSKVGSATTDVRAGHLRAELVVTLNAEGLFVAKKDNFISPSMQTKIMAIIDVVKAKVSNRSSQSAVRDGQFVRQIEVSERS